MSRFCLPVVVWLSDADRTRLAEFAGRVDAPTERVGARLISEALLMYTAAEIAGQSKPGTSTTRAGKAGKQYVAPRSRKQ
ncbi:hypothetical protein [Paraburkholderia sp. BR10882]|uniref:hypothetical protein n=1 Tax=unclassified Paraburkholderia TaxID=2615204 RepID=UPI0034CEDEED